MTDLELYLTETDTPGILVLLITRNTHDGAFSFMNVPRTEVLDIQIVSSN